jgi:hypothetical protein
MYKQQVAKLEEEDVLERQGHYASQGGHLPRMQIMERTTGKTTWRPPPHMRANECQAMQSYIYLPKFQLILSP